MSKVQKLSIDEIVRNMKEKLLGKGPNSKVQKQKTEKKVEAAHQINSDSELDALELFDNIAEATTDKKKDKNEKKEGGHKSILHNDKIEEEETVVVVKKPKSVKINEEVNVIHTVSLDKKWKDPIDNQKKGRFDAEEQKILSQAVQDFLNVNGITFQEFTRLVSETGQKEQNLLRKQKFFKLLASVLPNRSPESCYRFVSRNYNNFNHQGAWTDKQVQRLLTLVEKYNRKWKYIAKQMHRTSDNVYDKYRAIGEEGVEERVKNYWTIRQLIILVLKVAKQSGISFVDGDVIKQLEKEEEHDEAQVKELKEHKYNSKNFIFHNIEVIRKHIDTKAMQGVDLETIRWTKIIKHIPTKTVLDCRNKIVQLLQLLFKNQNSIDQELAVFLANLKVKDESKIDWKKWSSDQYTSQQARNRYLILKKQIEGRSLKPFPQILSQIQRRVTKEKEK